MFLNSMSKKIDIWHLLFFKFRTSSCLIPFALVATLHTARRQTWLILDGFCLGCGRTPPGRHYRVEHKRYSRNGVEVRSVLAKKVDRFGVGAVTVARRKTFATRADPAAQPPDENDHHRNQNRVDVQPQAPSAKTYREIYKVRYRYVNNHRQR